MTVLRRGVTVTEKNRKKRLLFTLSVHISKSINLPKNVAPTNNIKRIGSSVVTQVCFLKECFFSTSKRIFQTQFFDVLSSSKVFYVPSSERKDENDKFGEGESLRTCQQIMKETSAHIEISSGKDQSTCHYFSCHEKG